MDKLEIPQVFFTDVKTMTKVGVFRILVDIPMDNVGTVNVMALMTILNKPVKMIVEELGQGSAQDEAGKGNGVL